MNRGGAKLHACISLIGMPGCGKTTVGYALSLKLGWAFMDSDNLMESLYATPLQNITDALGKEAFLDMESEVIKSINVHECVIATGGSVVYRKKAIDHLLRLGPVVYIHIPFEHIEERIARNPSRGIAIGKNQTLKDLYLERKALYESACTHMCDLANTPPEECAEIIQNIITAKLELVRQ